MKKIAQSIFIICLILGLFGCTMGETEKLSIATAIGIDKSEEGVQVACQILNPHVLGRVPRQISSVTVFQEQGKTVFEAIAKLSKYFQSEIFLSHFQVLLISEELAKEGIEPYFNFFFNNTPSRHKFFTLITKDITALEVINIQTKLNIIPGISIEQKLLSSHKFYGGTREIYIDEIVSDIRTEQVNLVLPGVEVIGDAEKGSDEDNLKKTTPEAVMGACGLAVFKKDILVGWLDSTETIGYNILMGKLHTTVIPVTTSNKEIVSIKIKKSKSKIVYQKNNNMPSFTAKISIEGLYSEDMSGRIIRDLKYIEDITKHTEEEITKIIRSAIQKSQNIYDSDIFDLSKKIHQQDPKYWKQIKDQYDKMYKNININVDVKVNIIRNKY